MRPLLPGLALTAAAVVVALVVASAVPLSPLLVAMLLGLLYGSTLGIRLARTGVRDLGPGLRFAAQALLRVGVVLLGLRLAFADVVGLGWPVLLLVLGAVAGTFLLTLWVGRRMGMSTAQTVLVATGVSICGASAVVAVSSVVDAEEDDVVSTVALISLYGTVLIFLLPVLAVPAGLTAEGLGVWAGASVHEVAQVVATAGVLGSAALAPAVAVKLTRVALLAPVVALVGLWARRRSAATPEGVRPPAVPLFVVGFLVAVTVRSLGLLPPDLLAVAAVVEQVLFTAAMFALGSSVQVARLVRTAGSRLVLGLASTVAIVLVGLVGVTALGATGVPG